jgi:hypothetical protein
VVVRRVFSNTCEGGNFKVAFSYDTCFKVIRLAQRTIFLYTCQGTHKRAFGEMAHVIHGRPTERVKLRVGLRLGPVRLTGRREVV